MPTSIGWKSVTARQTFTLPAELKPMKGRAYVIGGRGQCLRQSHLGFAVCRANEIAGGLNKPCVNVLPALMTMRKSSLFH